MTDPDTASGRGRIPGRLIASQATSSLAALAVSAAVVGAAVFVTAAVPVLAARATTDQVRVALEDAGPLADVVVSVPLTGSSSPVLELIPDTADTADYIAERLDAGLPPELDAVLGTSITTLLSPELKMGAVDGVPARARFAYVTQGDDAAVEWIEGEAPARTGSAEEVLNSQTKPPIEVGVSEAVAEALGVSVGDSLPVEDPEGLPLEVTVSGIFAPVEGTHAFRTVPTLVTPTVITGTPGQLTVALLATRESIPAARLGAFPGTMLRYFTYPVQAGDITAENAAEIRTAALALASGKQTFEVTGAVPQVQTQLDSVLTAAIDRSAAATAQAAVLLLSIVALVALTQLLAAGAMIDQRAMVIAQLGARGASVPGVGRALAVESLTVTAVGAALGLAAQQLLAPGPVSWAWVAAPIAVGLLAAPLLGMRSARARRVPPAAQSRRRRSLATPTLRRLTASIALALAAVLAYASLTARGTAASQGSVAADLLVLAAPALCAAAAGVGLAWALPYVSRGLRALAAKGLGAGPLLTAARMRAPGTAIVALVLAGAVAALAASTAVTTREGLDTAAWDVVGADAVAAARRSATVPDDVLPDGDVVWAAAAPLGVGQLSGAPKSQNVDVVAVDAERMARLAEALPGGHPEVWDRLASTPLGDDGSVPMLQAADLAPVESGTLVWNQQAVPVAGLGPSPDLPGTAADAPTRAGGSVVVVDRAVLAEALGEPVPATIVWAAGPDAGEALAAALAQTDATVTTLDSWRADAQSAPVTRALTGLFVGSVIAAVALAILGVALLVAAGSRERARAMGRLRVVGLSAQRSRGVARGEVALPVVVASGLGVAVGLILTASLTTSLGLEAITSQSRAPEPVLAWWTLLVPAVLGVFAWLAVGVGLRLGRAPRLGEVLRVG